MNMRDKVPKKQKRDKKQVGTSQETKHVTSKLFESDAHVSWGQQMSNMYRYMSVHFTGSERSRLQYQDRSS